MDHVLRIFQRASCVPYEPDSPEGSAISSDSLARWRSTSELVTSQGLENPDGDVRAPKQDLRSPESSCCDCLQRTGAVSPFLRPVTRSIWPYFIEITMSTPARRRLMRDFKRWDRDAVSNMAVLPRLDNRSLILLFCVNPIRPWPVGTVVCPSPNDAYLQIEHICALVNGYCLLCYIPGDRLWAVLLLSVYSLVFNPMQFDKKIEKKKKGSKFIILLNFILFILAAIF